MQIINLLLLAELLTKRHGQELVLPFRRYKCSALYSVQVMPGYHICDIHCDALPSNALLKAISSEID